MINISEDCLFQKYKEGLASSEFDCEKEDLNDFFKKDALKFAKQMLGKSYCFTSKDSGNIVSIFTISNDSVKMDRIPKESRPKIKENIHPDKQGLKSYPAVLIGRLGVDIKYKHQNIGSQVLDFIKAWFIDEDNKTGCRFLFVDAYNDPSVLPFYRKNGFSYLIEDEKTEANYVGIRESQKLNTRKMFFDLIEIENS